MTNDVIFKVLWVDDQIQLNEGGQFYGFFAPMQRIAEDYNIELVPFDNWEEAETSLKQNFDDYSAIILDAYCKIRKSDTEQVEFINAILPSLLNIFGEKRRELPWYIFSAGTMERFDDVIKGANYQHVKNKENWGNMLYRKSAAENTEESPKKLFENIARVSKDLAMNVVLYHHQDTFKYLGEDKLIDARARRLMLRMLSALYYPEENIKFEYQGNPLRKVLECLFWSAHKNGLLPDEVIDKKTNCIIAQLASLFMAGTTLDLTKIGGIGTVRWGNQGDSIFTDEIKRIVNDIREFTNADSHTSDEDKKNWSIDEDCKDIFFSYVLKMCHVIRWYGKFVEKNFDVAVNKSTIQRGTNPVSKASVKQKSE